MKLIACKKCCDIVRLNMKMRICECGKSFGKYTDDVNAIYGGPCIPLGFANGSLSDAIIAQPASGSGQPFTAFVIPKQCTTFVKVKESSKPTRKKKA